MEPIFAIIATNSQANFAIIAIFFFANPANNKEMNGLQLEQKRWLIAELEKAGRGARKRLAEHLGLRNDAITRMTNLGDGETRDIAVEELIAMVSFFKSQPPGFTEALSVAGMKQAISTPLISWVSAGELMIPDSVVDIDDSPRTTGPDLDPNGDWIALTVEGDSMDLISPPESIIFVNRKDKRLVPNACYVLADENGHATYKRYRDGKFSPVSTNKKHKPIKIPSGHTPPILGRVRKSVLVM